MANKGQEGGLDSAGVQRKGVFTKAVTSELDLVRGWFVAASAENGRQAREVSQWRDESSQGLEDMKAGHPG